MIDDVTWFAANPDRSHRMRPLIEGESVAAAIPPGYVRRVRSALTRLAR